MPAGKPTALTPTRTLGVRAQCMLLASLSAITLSASALSFIVVDASVARIALAGAVLVAAAMLLALNRVLRPLEALALMLERHAGDDRAVSAGGAQRMLRNFTAIAARTEALRQRPRKNALTGLPTREAFLTLAANAAEGTRGGALGLIRFTNFEQISLDADVAERALARFAERLAAAVGEERPLAHVERDCFAIWLPEVNDACSQLQAIGYALGREISFGELSIAPEIKLGLAVYPDDADDVASLLNCAYLALQAAKPETGAVARAHPNAARRGVGLEQRLRQAVRRSEFTLHYQPFVDLAVGNVVGAEALLRWPSAPEISPAEIIEVAEDSGLINEIGLWTFNTACRQMREWRVSGLTGLRMAVNVSTHQFRDDGLPAMLERTLASHGLAPEHIELELTETAAMEDSQRVHASLHQLREAGFSLSIDDFGSGYSSLAYLRRLPFQKLKIDREFVSDIDKRADSRAICKALIDLTAGLELAVLAEGVERLEEVETLRMLGCPTFQGYYFARPMPGAEFFTTVTDADWLARTSSRVRREQHELRRRLS